jgi:nucleotidyltransferase/DNA polymerase involved in DNA repair
MTPKAGQEAGAGKRRERAQRREADRALVPVVVSRRLGVPVADAAHAVRAAGVTGPLTVRRAKEWAGDPGSAPQWLSGLRGERMARAAQQEYHREQQREQHAMRELTVERSALEKVKTGKRRFADDEWLLVEDWAFRAAKDLVRGGPGGEVGDFDYRVLRIVGVDPEDHATWPVHAGGCDGEGALRCAERIEEVRAQRRAEALTESVARETAQVAEVDGPLFEATYSLKSGHWRSAWFDVLALHPGGAS